MKPNFPIKSFEKIETPFYYYDTDLLRKTLEVLKAELAGHDNYHVHYAVKANANRRILNIISGYGFGADCVSGGEIEASLSAGFAPDTIVFAGVGKNDREITLALSAGISCFNVESVPELENIDRLAKEQKKTASIALRINPNVDAHTHSYITTGLSENKFGIDMSLIDKVLDQKECRMIVVTPDAGTFQIGDRTVEKDHRRTVPDILLIEFQIGAVVARTDQNSVDAVVVKTLEIQPLGQKVLVRDSQDDPIALRLEDPLDGCREFQVEGRDGLRNYDSDGFRAAAPQIHGHFVFLVSHLFGHLDHVSDGLFADIAGIR